MSDAADVTLLLERETVLIWCGYRSDIHFWKTGRIGPLIVESDCVLGHEAAGIVLKVGEGVSDLVVGEFGFLFIFVSVYMPPLFGKNWRFWKCCVYLQKRMIEARAKGWKTKRTGKSRE